MLHQYANKQFDNDNFVEYLLESEGSSKVDEVLNKMKEDLGDKLDDMNDRDFYKLYKTYALRSWRWQRAAI